MKRHCLSRNHAVAAACGCDASSQKVVATPSSRITSNMPFGLRGNVGDEASPAPPATRRRSHACSRARLRLHFPTAWFQFSSLTIALTVVLVAAAGICRAQDSAAIQISKESHKPGLTPPIPVSLEGFSGEVADVLKFDLYVQGFSFVAPDAAQYQISGSDSGNVTGSVTDRVAKRAILPPRSYTGASLRRQAHAFADDIVLAITGKKGIGQTQIAFKSQQRRRHG